MTTTPIVDCHTHTSFSDGVATFEENVRAAAALSCSVLVSTDHLTLPHSMDPDEECQVPEHNLAAHKAAFNEASALAAELTQNSKTPLELIYGFECDWYQGCEDNVSRWTKNATVRLGSVHWIGTGWIDNPEDMHVWEDLGTEKIWGLYVNSWCHACESPLNFDTMAHPDLVGIFTNNGYAPTFDLAPYWEQMAECAHDTGRRIEVSTAGLRKSVNRYYPAPGLLSLFAKAEVPITVGSDAHRACDICWGIRGAYQYAQAAGYRFVEVPHADGSWESVELA